MRRFAGNQEMENKMKMYRAPLALLLGTFTVFGCWQKLDENASSGITPVSADQGGGIGAKFPVDTTTPEIGETAAENGDPNTTAPDGCSKDAFDGQAMLTKMCDGCHMSGAIGNLVGIDTAQASLVGKEASSMYAGWKYLVAGDPSKSLIYQRVAVRQDMPPPSTVDSPLPHPSISDMSVLQQWIMCMGNAPSGGSTSPDGGTP
jgi:hypothetical protein